MSSVVCLNGPSTTVRLPPDILMRFPFALGCNPSPPSMMPALTSSSLYLPISVSSCSLGITPASLFFVALTMTMTFMVVCLSVRVCSVRRHRRHAGFGDGLHRRKPLLEVGADHLVHIHEHAEGLAHEVVLAVHGPGDDGLIALGLEREFRLVRGRERLEEFELDADELAR